MIDLSWIIELNTNPPNDPTKCVAEIYWPKTNTWRIRNQWGLYWDVHSDDMVNYGINIYRD